MNPALERNLRLIPWHQILVRSGPWISVFVLFTRSHFGLGGAIQLASIYYLSVVIFEVPSGWMSDRLGRALTLRLAALAWMICFSLFLFGDGHFWMIVTGQAFLALGYASLSGTDVAFHYDTLEALGRADEFADRESVVASKALVAGGLGALAGGLLGLADLRLAFALSLFLAIIQFMVANRYAEPPGAAATENMLPQVSRCLAYLSALPMAWIFGYGIAMVVLEHVASTLLQPWLTLVVGQSPTELGATPLVAGTLIAITAFMGAVFARSSARIGRRFGLRFVLVALGALSALIVSVMAVSTLPIVIALVTFRSAQGSTAPILISAAVAPVVARQHRATFLSLNSLAGRLSYGGLLLVLATNATDDVGHVLSQLAVVSWILVVVTALTAVLVARRERALS